MQRDTYYQFKMVLRQLDIFNVWKNIPEAVTYTNSNPAFTITIPAGNYSASSLAATINSLVSTAGYSYLTVAFDCSSQLFTFSDTDGVPATGWIPAGGTALPYLGFPLGYTSTTGVTTSQFPPNLAGVTRIHVETNLPLFTLPPSGRLASVPVDAGYGEMMSFTDFQGNHCILCTTHDLTNIEIRLTDQNGRKLDGYDEVPWGCVIEFEPFINNYGAKKLFGV